MDMFTHDVKQVTQIMTLEEHKRNLKTLGYSVVITKNFTGRFASYRNYNGQLPPSKSSLKFKEHWVVLENYLIENKDSLESLFIQGIDSI